MVSLIEPLKKEISFYENIKKSNLTYLIMKSYEKNEFN